jgi:ATP-dependent Clp protease ATP-binding subunit ClpA
VRGLPGGPIAILDELAEVGVLPVGSLPEDLAEARHQIEELEQERNDATSQASVSEEQKDEHERTIDDLNAEVAELGKKLAAQADELERWRAGEDVEVVPTVWVKTTSHRAREQLQRAARYRGVEVKAWFRKPARGHGYRREGEFWELPATLDVSGIKGATVLKAPVPKDELIRPISFR